MYMGYIMAQNNGRIYIRRIHFLNNKVQETTTMGAIRDLHDSRVKETETSTYYYLSLHIIVICLTQWLPQIAGIRSVNLDDLESGFLRNQIFKNFVELEKILVRLISSRLRELC